MCSKIGSYNLALEEQATELGFESLSQALEAGCVTGGDCDQPRLIEPLEAAHNAWEKEKEEVRVGLAMVADNLPVGSEAQQTVEHAIKFIEEVR